MYHETDGRCSPLAGTPLRNIARSCYKIRRGFPVVLHAAAKVPIFFNTPIRGRETMVFAIRCTRPGSGIAAWGPSVQVGQAFEAGVEGEERFGLVSTGGAQGVGPPDLFGKGQGAASDGIQGADR